jgi:hypothetical protein
MKRYVFAGFAFCLVVGFQNCSRNQLSDNVNNDSLSNPAQVTPAEKVDVSQTEMLEIPESAYLETQLQSDITQSKPTSTFSSHRLEIDVKTGVVHIVDQNNEVIEGLQYCLSSSDLNELHGILSSSTVCEDKAAADESLNCSMEYKFPYAKLHFAEYELSLGESMSGCHKGPDLCGVQKDMLQGFLAQVQNNLAAKKCQFQVVQK